MVARELRIGNLVVRHNGAIITVNSELLAYLEKYPNEKFMSNPPMDAIASIPLTEEWLLKFGYELNKDIGCYYSHQGGINLKKTDEGFEDYEDYYTSVDVTIKYVHQLQNLHFALTGEELTIKD